MGRLPAPNPPEVFWIFEVRGFVLVRQRGSHLQLRPEDGRGMTVANHVGRDIPPILLRQIARDMETTVEELIALR